MSLPTLTLIAAPYGLGPASKAIALAHAAKGKFRCSFIGSLTACSIAKLTNLFEHVDQIDYSSQFGSAHSSCQTASHTVFINTTRFISNRAKLPGKLYMVDTLAWMRTSPPNGAHHLEKYYVQTYISNQLASSIVSLGSTHEVEPIIVDPTLDAPLPRTDLLAPHILVQVGGMGSPAAMQGSGNLYIKFLIANLNNLEGNVTLVLPPNLHQDFPSEGKVQIACATPLTIGSLIRQSDLVLTTSGIEFMYECAARRTPMVFLPPFNATQEQQLSHLARHTPSAVLFSFHVGILAHKFEDLDRRTQSIQTAGQHGAWQRQLRSIFSTLGPLGDQELRDVTQLIQSDQDPLFAKYSFRGAQAIVNGIYNG